MVAEVLAENPSDISSAIRCAVAAGVPVVARSGGHSYGAYSIGGAITTSDPTIDPDQPIPGEPSLIIDLRPMRRIRYNVKQQTVTVGSGTLLGEMNEQLEQYQRTVPSGACPTVGVGGQALAGGFGLMSRCVSVLLHTLAELMSDRSVCCWTT